jgi:hypothetical protein
MEKRDSQGNMSHGHVVRVTYRARCHVYSSSPDESEMSVAVLKHAGPTLSLITPVLRIGARLPALAYVADPG